MLLYIVFIERQ